MVTRSSEVEISTVRKKCKGGHKIGYCSSWKEDYPWLVPTEDTAGIVTGLLCEICKCQESSSSGIWTTVPCTSPLQGFPQLSRLASIALIIPVSTAECERCFSSMNRIKTDLRNR